MRIKPIIAISCGDPAGIGPEIAIKITNNQQIRQICFPIIAGAKDVIKEAQQIFSPNTLLQPFNPKKLNDTNIFYEDFGLLQINHYQKGKASKKAGELAYQTIIQTTKAVKNKIFDAIVTAPVSKEAINLAGHKFYGHTELIAQLCNCKNFVMLQSSDQLNIAFVSNHIPIAEAVNFITEERLTQVIKLFNQALKKNGEKNPKIAIAGFNPHAGENGFIGSEEINIIIPTIRKLNLNLFGPFPADSLFIKSIREQFDGIICMYHDQGHIPFKMLAFDRGVNCTLGLPIIRTSVDHGTAFDIAWQNKAFTTSLEQAIIKSVQFFHKKNNLSNT